jgi:UDP-N-acetylglucosamine--N-acetylmuramyl-(pentapeptide) pyrophosphoryl-undecaprenol N-acetylglucosamine transferase
MAAASAATGERGADELLADMVSAAFADSLAGQR